MKNKLYALAGILLALPTLASAQLVFSAPPRGSEAEEKATYEPLTRAMSEWLGTEVVYEYPRDFMTYSFNMRDQHYDFVFDGPHFSSWRMENINHEAIVTLPERLVFFVVTPADNQTITDLDSLVMKKVCGQAPPQLGTLFLMSQFTNPAREPIIDVVKGEDNVFKALKSGECKVAILRDKVFAKMNPAERSKYRVLYSSRPVPNDAITAGPRVTASQRLMLREKLTDPGTAVVAEAIFKRFSNRAQTFEPAVANQFDGLNKLLERLSYGW